MSDDLLPIGRFARLCRLSVKQLRHYDDLGVLSPAWTDPASGYRYYRPAQARNALMEAKGLVVNGLHHEIYLSDTRETDPEKKRTILRQPVR